MTNLFWILCFWLGVLTREPARQTMTCSALNALPLTWATSSPVLMVLKHTGEIDLGPVTIDASRGKITFEHPDQIEPAALRFWGAIGTAIVPGQKCPCCGEVVPPKPVEVGP